MTSRGVVPVMPDKRNKNQFRWRRLRALGRAFSVYQETPESLARGMAIGVFVAFAAPPGIQVVIALAVTYMAGVSRLAAVAGAFVTNPFTMPVIYPVAYWIGSWITGRRGRGSIPDDQADFWAVATSLGTYSNTFINLTVGLLVLGSLASIIGYQAVKIGVVQWRARREPPRDPPSD